MDEICTGAVGAVRQHRDGYGNPGVSGLGYVSVVKLSTGQDDAGGTRPSGRTPCTPGRSRSSTASCSAARIRT